MDLLRPFSAIILFYCTAFILSENKKRLSYKVLSFGILLQFATAALLFEVPAIALSLNIIASGLQAVSESTIKSLKFCFGQLGAPDAPMGFILALHGFTVLITISALSALLMHWRILPTIIKVFSFFFRKTLAIGGTLGISISANMFTGMSETPLVIKPYLNRLTRSELFSLVTCGIAGIAGSVIVLYSVILEPIMPNNMHHIISSVLIGIPIALTISRIIVPETEDRLTEGADIELQRSNNTLDAIFTGIMDGAKVMVTIIAMFIGFISLIDIANKILAHIYIFDQQLSIQYIMGIIFAPITWLIGIPWEEAGIAGSLLGTRFITNELVAYQEFVEHGMNLSTHTKIIMLYALCGFANVGSIGIILGVYSTLVPSRKEEISKFALKALIAGTLSNCISASIVSILN